MTGRPGAKGARPVVVLSDEDFGDFPPGPLPCDYSPLGEYHVPPLPGYRGRWREGSLHSSWRGTATWQVLPFAEGPAMVVSRERRHAHALLVTGDPLWGDADVEVGLRPLAAGAAGVCGRVLHNRRYVALWLWAGLELRVTERDHEAERVLASAPWPHGHDTFHRLRLAFHGRAVAASVDGGPQLHAETDVPCGAAGLVASSPAAYRAFRVTCGESDADGWRRRRRAWDAAEAEAGVALPAPRLWRTIDTPGFGAGRAVRWGDLDGDGQLEFVVAQNSTIGPGQNAAAITCLTACDLHGRVLWRWGRPNPALALLTYDVPLQIHDLDGDGRPEVVAATHFELTVRDGATGRVRAAAPLPTPGPRTDRLDERLFRRIPGDCLCFADLRGAGHPGDILVKDRYNNLWALDGRDLRPLWRWSGVTGHFPAVRDLDGDGRDEVFCGDSLLGPDGAVRWRRPLEDHADGVAMGPWGCPTAGPHPMRIIVAAGDAGIVWYDADGQVLARDNTGHTQGITLAPLRPGQGGLQQATTTFWREPGLVTLYDRECRRIGQHQPTYRASHLEPVNWAGDGSELLLLDADPEEGGLLDGWGRRPVRLPRDGHPTLCAEAVDLTGDPRDEIVVWDADRMWIYTQDRPAPPGRLYRPVRLPRHNTSNYRAQVSLPAWEPGL